jgi:uncharacterized protein YcbX
MPAVSRLQITPIKGIRLNDVVEVSLSRAGAAGDRRFFLIDERDRKVNGKALGVLQTVSGSFSEDDGILSLHMPDGELVRAPVALDSSTHEAAFGDFRMGRLVSGPWADALSELCGRRLRLVMTDSAVDRGTKGAVSLISRESVRRLSEQAGGADHDPPPLKLRQHKPRRFRMLIEIDGVPAHAEDSWVGRELRIGGASLRFEGHVGRCLVTCRDPDSGEVTLPTLDLLRSYRGELDTTEPLAFGIYGRVLQGGVIRVGDPVSN